MNIEGVKDKIRTYIVNVIGEQMAKGLTDDSSVIQSRLLDSISTLQLVAFLEEEYGIEINAHEIMDENFDTINKISDFVIRKKNG